MIQSARSSYYRNNVYIFLQADPSQKVRAVIGFGDNSISQALQPFLTDDEVPQVGTREDLNDFGDKVGFV